MSTGRETAGMARGAGYFIVNMVTSRFCRSLQRFQQSGARYAVLTGRAVDEMAGCANVHPTYLFRTHHGIQANGSSSSPRA